MRGIAGIVLAIALFGVALLLMVAVPGLGLFVGFGVLLIAAYVVFGVIGAPRGEHSDRVDPVTGEDADGRRSRT